MRAGANSVVLRNPLSRDASVLRGNPLDGVLGVWIALDPATVENGCMQIAPGSHRAGPAPHYHVRDCQLVDQASRAARAEVVPLGPGAWRKILVV